MELTLWFTFKSTDEQSLQFDSSAQEIHMENLPLAADSLGGKVG